ncbi:AsnC family protein [Psychromicrobium xiongbiense]|uniref:AsnC family protein n=1 Tax=Psychromicrobium xiongbiense TaxID=3051184 RepID=UPI002556B911|nr:AsnC family protein [Psychromicrobium sp. YIM S02556]
MEAERMKTLIGDMDGENPTEALYALSELQREVSRTEAALVRRARQSGMSWELIAVCLGVSKQAVHKKFGKA